MCEAYKQECLDNWHSPGLYLKPDFKKGFEEACKLLLPEIEKLEDALGCISCDCYQTESDFIPCKRCEALQSLRDFLGEESEGGDE